MKTRGAALIPALLILAIAAGLAAALASRLDANLQFAIYRRDEIAARQLALAGLDYACSVLWEDARVSQIDAPTEIWAANIGALPVEGGTVRGALRDAQGAFNVNNLLEGPNPAADIEAFERLAVSLGAAPGVARARVQPLAKPEGGLLADVDEFLVALALPAELATRLRPYLAALPGRTRINVNTAAPEVVAAYLPGLGLSQVIDALGSGDTRKVFTTTADFAKLIPAIPLSDITTRLGVDSRYFLLAGEARQGRAVIRSEALIGRESRRWPRVIYVRMSP